MSTDFRVSTDFFSHHKTRKLKKRLGNDGVIALLRLWSYAARIKPDGDLSGMSVEDIELASEWEGQDGIFVNTLIESGFVDSIEDSFVLHDWQEHNPWAAGTEGRSDKSRLSRMAGTHPEIYQRLVNEGRTGISKKEYEFLTRSGENKDSLTVVNVSFNEPLTFRQPQGPAPAPVPIPEPEDKDKNKNLPPSPLTAFGERPPEGGSTRLELRGLYQCIPYVAGFVPDPVRDNRFIHDLEQEYPRVNLLSQIHIARDWLEKHPSKRPKIDLHRFFRNWMARARQGPLEFETIFVPAEVIENGGAA
jgi:hypothetical protein